MKRLLARRLGAESPKKWIALITAVVLAVIAVIHLVSFGASQTTDNSPFPSRMRTSNSSRPKTTTSSSGTYSIDGFKRQEMAPFQPLAPEKKSNLQGNPYGTAHSHQTVPQEMVQYRRQPASNSPSTAFETKTGPKDQLVAGESAHSTNAPSVGSKQSQYKVPKVQINAPNFQDMIYNPALTRRSALRRTPFRPVSASVAPEPRIGDFIYVTGQKGTSTEKQSTTHDVASASSNSEKADEREVSTDNTSVASRAEKSKAANPNIIVNQHVGSKKQGVTYSEQFQESVDSLRLPVQETTVASNTKENRKSKNPKDKTRQQVAKLAPAAKKITARPWDLKTRTSADAPPKADPKLTRLPAVKHVADPPAGATRTRVAATQTRPSQDSMVAGSNNSIKLTSADETVAPDDSDAESNETKHSHNSSFQQLTRASDSKGTESTGTAEAKKDGPSRLAAAMSSLEIKKKRSKRKELVTPTIAPAVAFRDQGIHSSRRHYMQYQSDLPDRSTVRHAGMPRPAAASTECRSCDPRASRRQVAAPAIRTGSAPANSTVSSEARSASQDFRRPDKQPYVRQPVLRSISHSDQPNPDEVAPSPSDAPTERESRDSQGTAPTIIPDQQPDPFEDDSEAVTDEPQESVLDPAFVYEQPVVESQFDDDFGWSSDCGFGCPPGWYAIAEAFWARREGEPNASLSNDIRLDSFDYELGGRITIGRKFDCLDGWEVSFVGPLQYEVSGFAAGNSVNSKLRPAGGVDLSAFNGAASHLQSYESELISAELNQKWWGWDVITTSWGLRYLRLDEEFILRATQANGDVGLFDLDATTDLIGPQVGMDMIFPIGRWTFSSKTKLGAFLSAARTRTRVVNAGVVQIDNGDRRHEIGALVEVGFYAKRRLLPRVQLTIGYDFWYIYGVAIATEQTVSPVTPTTGSQFMDPYGDIFVHGATVGIEAVW